MSEARFELKLFDEALLSAFIEHRFDQAARLLDADLEPGWPDVHDEAFLRSRLKGARDARLRPGGARAVVGLSPTRRMIGHAGFHGPPGVNALGLDRAVELGYTVFPAWTGMGYATEVAGALMKWAGEEHGVTEFVASASPINGASLAVIRKLGFVFIREADDDVDGLEHVYLRR